MKLYKIKRQKPDQVEIRDLREKFFLMDDEYVNGWAAILPPSVTMVYMLLCRHVNREQYCFPSVTTMGKKLGVSRVTVIHALRLLEQSKIITVERKMGGKSIYWLNSKSHWKKPKVQNAVSDAI